MELKFDETTNKYLIETPTIEGADMEQAGVLRGITSLEVMGLPLGVAGVTALVDFFVDKLAGEKLAGWGALGQLGLAYMVKQYGARFVGSQVADAFALLVTYDVVQATVQSWLGGVWPGAQAPVSQSPMRQSQAVHQAQKVAETAMSRYAAAF
jgi:hypothetical protein